MSNSLVPALTLTGVLLALFLILWFAYPAWYRNRATNVLSSPAEEI
jgi:hypothetical protein